MSRLRAPGRFSSSHEVNASHTAPNSPRGSTGASRTIRPPAMVKVMSALIVGRPRARVQALSDGVATGEGGPVCPGRLAFTDRPAPVQGTLELGEATEVGDGQLGRAAQHDHRLLSEELGETGTVPLVPAVEVGTGDGEVGRQQGGVLPRVVLPQGYGRVVEAGGVGLVVEQLCTDPGVGVVEPTGEPIPQVLELVCHEVGVQPGDPSVVDVELRLERDRRPSQRPRPQVLGVGGADHIRTARRPGTAFVDRPAPLQRPLPLGERLEILRWQG